MSTIGSVRCNKTGYLDEWDVCSRLSQRLNVCIRSEAYSCITVKTAISDSMKRESIDSRSCAAVSPNCHMWHSGYCDVSLCVRPRLNTCINCHMHRLRYSMDPVNENEDNGR